MEYKNHGSSNIENLNHKATKEEDFIGRKLPMPRGNEFEEQLELQQGEQPEAFKDLKYKVSGKLLQGCRENSYVHIRKLAIKYLQDNTLKQLNSLYNLNKCKKDENQPLESLAHNIFNWSMEDFQERRNLNNFVWVDVLKKTEESCLNAYKFGNDLVELQKFLQRLFKGLILNEETDGKNLQECAVKSIKEAEKLLHIPENIQNELTENKRFYKEFQLADSVFAHIKRDSIDNMKKIGLETQLQYNHIWNPIELRYQTAWNDSQTNQYKYLQDIKKETLQGEIKKIYEKIDQETIVGASTMDFYYAEMEQLKNSTSQMQTKFDSEYEKLENSIAQKRAQIKELNEQRTFYSKEIQHFRKEIELMRLREEPKAEALEMKRLEIDILVLNKGKAKVKKKGNLKEAETKEQAEVLTISKDKANVKKNIKMNLKDTETKNQAEFLTISKDKTKVKSKINLKDAKPKINNNFKGKRLINDTNNIKKLS